MIASSLSEDKCGNFKHINQMHFQQADLILLEKFKSRTIFCLGTLAATHIFQKAAAELACSHRFLMHLIQAVTACQDRYLAGPSLTEPSPTEAYHLNLGLVLFQHKLTQPLRPTDRDALFVAASLTGIASFASIPTMTVEESWPLKGSDLNWLHLSSGKQAVVKLSDPLRKDSMWKAFAQQIDRVLLQEREGEPRCTVFDHLCDAPDSPESPDGNPYHDPVYKLAPLLELECLEANWLRLLCFMMRITPTFTGLLQQKDPWAMLMFAYWCAKVCESRWWLTRRAILDGLAICLYIERNCQWDEKLQEAVIWPKAKLERLMAVDGLSYS